jgi:adenylate cyclase
MWNAPVPQPDHAVMACRAAMAMLGELAGLNDRWSERIKTTLALGIGLNTGIARVGNTGSVHRLKYGPLGSTVNLASRVEGVTKQFEVPVLITESTHEKLAGSFQARKLAKVRVVGIDTPVVLYELHGETALPGWIAFRDAYESALAHFEKGHLSEACRELFPMLDDSQGRNDQPSLILASRALDGLKSRGRDFDPVIAFQAK